MLQHGLVMPHMVTTCALLAIGVPRLWELTIASSKVLHGPPRCSKVLQGPPRPRKTLSYNRPWRTLDNSYMTYNDLGDYLQYICYLACYLSSVSSLATGSLVLCNAVLGTICDQFELYHQKLWKMAITATNGLGLSYSKACNISTVIKAQHMTGARNTRRSSQKAR